MHLISIMNLRNRDTSQNRTLHIVPATQRKLPLKLKWSQGVVIERFGCFQYTQRSLVALRSPVLRVPHGNSAEYVTTDPRKVNMLLALLKWTCVRQLYFCTVFREGHMTRDFSTQLKSTVTFPISLILTKLIEVHNYYVCSASRMPIDFGNNFTFRCVVVEGSPWPTEPWPVGGAWGSGCDSCIGCTGFTTGAMIGGSWEVGCPGACEIN